MRLAYLVSQYPTINHTFILREIRGLRDQGFDIHVISIRPPDRAHKQLTTEEQEEAAKTIWVTTAGIGKIVAAHLKTIFQRPFGYLRGFGAALRMGHWQPKKIFQHLLYFAEAVVAGQWMITRKLSHFHTHFSSTVGLLAVRIFPLTMSITIHGPDEFNDPIGFHVTEKVAASRFVSTISYFGRSQLMRICDPADWGKIEVCRLGVNAKVFSPRPLRDFPETFEILCVARLAPVKAHRILIDAVHVLVNQDKRVRLHLAGDGPDRAELEKHVASLGLKEVVIFHGWLNQDRIRDLYQRADAFALASFAEGVPVVLMEAMAMEIPCVATYIAGVPELITDHESGLLVPASDVQSFAAALGRLIDNPHLRKRLGAAGRTKVLQDFDLTRNTMSLAEVMKQHL